MGPFSALIAQYSIACFHSWPLNTTFYGSSPLGRAIPQYSFVDESNNKSVAFFKYSIKMQLSLILRDVLVHKVSNKIQSCI